MKENPFFKSHVVDFSSMDTFMRRFVKFRHNFTINDDFQALDGALLRAQNIYSWADFVDILEDYNYTELFDITGYLGYYSTNSVCISKLYVTPTDKAWPFSLAIITLNFVAFMFVAVAYIWIYKRSAASGRQVNERAQNARAEKQNQEMQKKIIRLVFTDFFCWVPISIMAFLNFGGTTVPPVIYAVSAIILLPINSSLNPLIYSNAPKMLYDRVRKRLHDVRRRQQPHDNRRVNVAVVAEAAL
uniref:Uncharacterized protein LOC108950436 n=1 Tax=Phallusia mammillata TaxID=59560 RepID=A0A6F9DK06_9ASCI|nr:uncharacterized protein LOC108950436 [Phallusia mammillata]